MQSVSELTEQIKTLMESTFMHVRVQGEISRPTYHNSGHLYFTLKDDKCSISCVMFRGNVSKLKFRLKESMAVEISGSISVYAPRGSYQINCVSLEPQGVGSLALAYEQLKKELSQKGYFEQKRALPKFPQHIALVTSKTGAALQDMLKVAKNRWPLVKITLCDTLVQGESAKYEIVKAIKKAQTLNPNIIVVSRGGGSVEDLWAFNEKEVALALYESSIPTLSAIGHAIDTLITDFVADASAPTPSAAMEMILPDINEQRVSIDILMQSYERRFESYLDSLKMRIDALKKQLILLSPKTKLELFAKDISTYKELYHIAIKQKINLFQSRLNALFEIYKGANPKYKLKDGYAQVVKDGRMINLKELKKDDTFELQDTNMKLNAKVI